MYIVTHLILISSICAQSLQEMQKLRSEYEKYKSLQRKTPVFLDQSVSDQQKMGDLPSDYVYSPFNKAEKDTIKNSSSYFGYDFLRKETQLDFGKTCQFLKITF